MASSSRRPAFTLVEIIVAVVVIGLLASLTVGGVLSAFRLKEERSVQENLQQVWIAANEYFLEKNTTSVSTADLFAPEANLAAILKVKPIHGEDYTQINGGTISATDTQLSLTYQKGGDSTTHIYFTK